MSIQTVDVVARRELEFSGPDGSKHAVELVLGRPTEEPGGPWYCAYVIEAQPFQRQMRIAGEDSMQAILLALKTIVVELEVLGREHRGTFTWFGEPDLGFA